MYELNEDTQKIEFSHNPFSMPQGGLEALERADPLTIKAYQYDIVCNGVELSSGAIRNHRPDIMYKAFALAGYRREDVEARFGGMLNAFKYGAPPHGGSAPGIDRIVMLLAGETNIREVIAFPMNQQAQDLLMRAPGPVPPERLKELHLKLDLPSEDSGKEFQALSETTAITRRLTLAPDLDLMPLLGRNDDHLRTLESELDIRIVARGHDIMLKGDERQVKKAERALVQLAELVRAGTPLRAGEVRAALRDALGRRPGRSEERVRRLHRGAVAQEVGRAEVGQPEALRRRDPRTTTWSSPSARPGPASRSWRWPWRWPRS